MKDSIEGKKQVLNEAELKKIIDVRSICASTPDYRSPITYCTDDAFDAEVHAGPMGWWCCNCKEAIDACKKD